MTSKPELHGRDHKPGGADPIPNFESIVAAASTAGLPVCYGYTTSAYTLADDGDWHSPDWDVVRTNNASVFSQDALDASLIQFSGGYYLVGYQAYMDPLPTSPAYVASIWSELGAESPPAAGRGIIGDWVRSNTVTSAFYSADEIASTFKSWQNIQLFQPAPDSPNGGFYHLLLENDAGAAVDIEQFLFYAVRLSGTADTGDVGTTAGIFFDTDNLGDWLQVLTTGDGALVTTGVGTLSAGIGMVSQGGNLVLGTTDGGGPGNDDVYIDSGSDIFLRCGADGNLTIDGGSGNDSSLFVNNFPQGVTLDLNGGFVQMTIDGFTVDSDSGISINQTNIADSNGITISDTGTGGLKFYVGAGGILAMHIESDGTIHIPTGATIHADL